MSDEIVGRQLRTISGLCLLAIALAGVLPCISGDALAQTGPPTGFTPTKKVVGNPQWSSLTNGQRRALAPLERDWSGLDAARKAKWLEIAAKYPNMPPDEQGRMQDRMYEWARMTPTERGRARLSFQDAKQLAPRERQAQWDAYKALSEGERRALAGSASAPTTNSSRLKSAADSSGRGISTLSAGTPASSARPAKVVQPITPTLVQGGPGATTTPISRAATPPSHQLPGQPRIAAAPGQVDRATLLPRKIEVSVPMGAASGPTEGKKAP